MTPQEWAELVWEFGNDAFPMYLSGAARFSAPDGALKGAAPLAAESAQMLVNARGGDALERAEFARLFAIGEPQQGLRAFLARRKGMSVAEKK